VIGAKRFRGSKLHGEIMLKHLLMLVVFSLASLGVHAKNDEAFIELEKTDQVIEFEVEFLACGAKTKLKIQDGSMGILRVGDSDVVRFVVKKERDGDIKLFPVKKTKFKNGNSWVDGLMLQQGVSIVQSVSVAEMTKAGIKSVAYHGLYPAPASTQGSRVSDAPSASGSTSTTVKCGAALGMPAEGK
jgi:hypothetical protein